MKKILVINGPNLNMLGIREKEIYGKEDYNSLINYIKVEASRKGLKVDCYQSNHEGDLVDRIQSAYFEGVDGIVINPGAYTHTSVAILDALKSVNIKAVEVHISDIYNREDFRRISYIKDYCAKTIVNKGLNGYIEAIKYLASSKE